MADATPISPRRKWAALALGTFTGLVAYWIAVLTLATPLEDADQVPEASAAIGVAIALVPLAFFGVASVSERPQRWWGTLAATAVGMAVGAAAALIARDLATGVVAGLGAGGAVALRADRAGWLVSRGIGVLVAAAYVAILVRVTPLLAILMAPLLPFLAVGLADAFAERLRARRSTARTS